MCLRSLMCLSLGLRKSSCDSIVPSLSRFWLICVRRKPSIVQLEFCADSAQRERAFESPPMREHCFPSGAVCCFQCALMHSTHNRQACTGELHLPRIQVGLHVPALSEFAQKRISMTAHSVCALSSECGRSYRDTATATKYQIGRAHV